MQIADLASRPSFQQPHTLIFFIATLMCLVIAVFPPMFFNRDRSWERRVAWLATGAAVTCAFLATLPDWKLGIGVSLFGAGIMILGAYFSTPYIKIRGKIYAFHVQDSLPDPAPDGAPLPGSDDPGYHRAPDSYGGLATARKFWWLQVPTMAMCVLCVVIKANDKPWWLAPAMATLLVVAAFALGYEDARWGYSIARGQRVQFGIIAVITAGVFTVLYLGAYYAGKRWPLRRKQSMEYLAHPRHQERYR